MACEKTIENPHVVFRKCHQEHWDFENQRPENGAFEFDSSDDTMSVYWSHLIEKENVLPLFNHGTTQAHLKNGLLALVAGKVREEATLDLLHTPHDKYAPHPAHSSVIKTQKPFNRLKVYAHLKKNCEVVIEVPPKM